MNWKFLFYFSFLIFILYLINYYTDGWILYFIYHFPKYAALIVSILAIMFPKNWHDIPNYFYEKNKLL